MATTRNCVTCHHGHNLATEMPCPTCGGLPAGFLRWEPKTAGTAQMVEHCALCGDSDGCTARETGEGHFAAHGAGFSPAASHSAHDGADN